MAAVSATATNAEVARKALNPKITGTYRSDLGRTEPSSLRKWVQNLPQMPKMSIWLLTDVDRAGIFEKDDGNAAGGTPHAVKGLGPV